MDAAVPFAALIRPLLVAITVTLGVQMIASVLARDVRIGAFVGLIVALALVGLEAILIALLVAVVPSMFGLARDRRLRPIAWDTLTRLLNTVSVALVVVASTNAAAHGTLASDPGPSTAIAPAPSDRPDIFLILLDGYPRADTLANEFGIDNTPWLDQMTAIGFQVAEGSRSNYNMTQLTLPSVFAFQHVLEQRGIDPRASTQDQWRALSRALNAARGIDALHAAGYEITTIPAPFEMTKLRTADIVLASDVIDEFEVGLLHRPLLRHLFPDLQRTWLADQYRAALIEDFRALNDQATAADHPRFIFAHILAPHPPLVFDAAGGPGEPAECFPSTCQLWNSGYADGPIEGQLNGFLDWTNARTLETVRSIQARANTPPVVVIFSDHGFRHRLNDQAESTTSLFLANTPGHDGLFPDDTTPINILPRVLNAYAGTDLPLAPEDICWADLTKLETAGPLALQLIEARP